MSLEEIVKSLASNTQMFQQKTRASIQNLETQVSQLASSLNKLETSKGKLPSQAEINPIENASAITLRSGKEVVQITPPNLTIPEKNKMEVEPTTQEATIEEVRKTPIFPNSKILVAP